jgi:type I restriction enzyme, S subunit
MGIAAVPLCTNQGCKTLVPRDALKAEYLYFALRQAVQDLQALGSGATFAEISKSQVEGFCIPVPSLGEQERIASRLTERLAAVERARQAARARLDAAEALPAAYLREVFEGTEAETARLDAIAEIQLGKMAHPDNRRGVAPYPYLRHANVVEWGRFDLSDMDFDEE